jgi:hypothetical protein
VVVDLRVGQGPGPEVEGLQEGEDRYPGVVEGPEVVESLPKEVLADHLPL